MILYFMILHLSLDIMKKRSMNAHLILRKCSTHFAVYIAQKMI